MTSVGYSNDPEEFANQLEKQLLNDGSSFNKEVVEEEEIHDLEQHSLGRKRRPGTYSDGDTDNEKLIRSVKQRFESSKDMYDPKSSLPQGETSLISVPSSVVNICTHPAGCYAGVCVRCGENVYEKSGVARSCVHKSLRLRTDRIFRLRDIDLKSLLRQKKLCLVLDLDHTLLNSTGTRDITPEEMYLLKQASGESLTRFDWIEMVTKLRPYVHTFLKEASELFEMYIYTMGDRLYAIQMAKLLDLKDNYFRSKIIAQEDCTQLHKKGLDLILGKESAVLILDDTEWVWEKHKDNLVLIEKYHFFASSCKLFGCNTKSLSETKRDEEETDGALASMLKVLQKIHSWFFDSERTDKPEDRDVREVLKNARKEVLKGCNLVFNRIFPAPISYECDQLFWEMAEQLGATCSTDLDPSVTHVVSVDSDTDMARWAVKENKFLVNPKWVEAANSLWKKPPEDNFTVSQVENIPPSHF